MAGNRQYVCNLWPELTIGANIRFLGGFFQTDDPKLQQLVESRDAFGTSIHYKDTIEVMEASTRLDAEKRANDRARRRQEFLDALDEEDRKELGGLASQLEADRKVEAEWAAEAKLKAAGKVVDNDSPLNPPLASDALPPGGSLFGGVVGTSAPAVPPVVETAADRQKRENAEADAKKKADAEKKADAAKTNK